MLFRSRMLVQVRDLQVEIAAITSQHAAALDSKRILEDKQALMTQELNELRTRKSKGSSAVAQSAPGEAFMDCPALSLLLTSQLPED